MQIRETQISRCRELEFLSEASLAKSIDDCPEKEFFGFFCSYFPEELVLAAGFEPVRIFPPAGNANPPELPAFCCSLARGSLAQATKGELSGLSGVGFAHTCDTMQCLSGIWAERIGNKAAITLVPPVMLNSSGAAEYLQAELSHALKKLSELSGKTTGSEELADALELCQEIRSLVTRVEKLRGRVPSDLFSQVLRAGQVLPRKRYLEALQEVVPYLEQHYLEEKGLKLLLTGAIFESDSLFEMIEELGGRVVVDDTCSGSRHYSDIRKAKAGAMEGIVHRLLQMPPCPCRNGGLDSRLDYLEQQAGAAGVSGAIIAVRKFCEPHSWDAVPLSQRLKDSGIKTLVLEMEGSEVGGQERTRLQAFMESF
jgi:benzoyl-CoA reductase subunit C